MKQTAKGLHNILQLSITAIFWGRFREFTFRQVRLHWPPYLGKYCIYPSQVCFLAVIYSVDAYSWTSQPTVLSVHQNPPDGVVESPCCGYVGRRPLSTGRLVGYTHITQNRIYVVNNAVKSMTTGSFEVRSPLDLVLWLNFCRGTTM